MKFMDADEERSDSNCVDEGGYSLELTDNTPSVLATLATVGSNTKLVTQVGHTAGTFATNFTNLTIGNLAANAHVHGISSKLANHKS